MKRIGIHRLLVATLLLAVMLSVDSVKAFHHHSHCDCTEEESSECTGEHGHSDCGDDCLICQFLFEPYLPSEASSYPIIIPVVTGEYFYCCEDLCTIRVLSSSLRAPPSAIA